MTIHRIGRAGVAAALLLSASAAGAADLAQKPAAPAAETKTEAPPLFDIAFGSAVMNDYIFRGITQSNHKPSVAAYTEFRYYPAANLQFYAAIAGESISFPNNAAAEIDFYAGFRPTFDKLSLDFGAWYYDYPGGRTFTGLGPSEATCTNLFFTPTGFCNAYKGNASYFEVFGKGTYTLTDQITLGANVFYAPSWLNSGADGTFASGTVKVTAPSAWFAKDWGGYASAEYGHYWFGTTDPFYGTPAFPNGIKYPDYNTWNLGGGLTYKVFTLDLRYSDTDLSKADCNVLTGAQSARFNPANITPTNPSGLGSNWCGATFIAKLSVDLTLADLK